MNYSILFLLYLHSYIETTGNLVFMSLSRLPSAFAEQYSEYRSHLGSRLYLLLFEKVG